MLTAFRDLILSRGYDAVTVSDVVERANVGRSTFYEHYEDKEDLFRQSLRAIVPPLADAVCADDVASTWNSWCGTSGKHGRCWSR